MFTAKEMGVKGPLRLEMNGATVRMCGMKRSWIEAEGKYKPSLPGGFIKQLKLPFNPD